MNYVRLTIITTVFVIFGVFTAFAQSTVTIQETRQIADGTVVTVQGVAVTPSLESASRTSFFIQEGMSGINVYIGGTPVKMIEVGDMVQVTGELTTFNGLREIVPADLDTNIVVISSGNPVPAPRDVTYGEFMLASDWMTDDLQIQSTLVRFNGLTTDPNTWPADSSANSANVSATDEFGNNYLIRLMAQTEVIGLTPPANFNLTAVVGTYNNAQLIPRFNSDVEPASVDSFQVTFQVNMNQAIDSAQFVPAEHAVYVVGSFTGWDQNPQLLEDAEMDGIYSATLPVPEGTVFYKYYAETDRELEWEWTDDKEIVVTSDTTLPANYFEAGFRDLNGLSSGPLEIEFKVDMTVQIQNGLFNPEFEDVTVVGEFDDFWNPSANYMWPTEDPNIYQGYVSFEAEQFIPKTYQYKFTIQRGGGETFWETFEGNRFIEVTEADYDTAAVMFLASNYADSIPFFSNEAPIAIPEEITIAQAREVAAGEVVTVRGIVTRTSGVYTNIQQDTAGLLTFTPSGPYFDAVSSGEVAMGDSVLLSGFREDYNGQKELVNVLQFEVLSRDNTLPAPAVLTLSEFKNSGINYQAELIQIDNLSILGQSHLFAGNFYIANLLDTDETIRFVVPVAAENRLGGQPVPEVFNFVGVAGYSEANPGVKQQLIGIEANDVVEVQPPLDVLPLSNGSFEFSPLGEVFTNTPGWYADTQDGTPAQAVFEVVGNEVYSGNKAMKVSINEVGAEEWFIQVVNVEFDVVVDQPYTISVWAKTDVPGSAISFTVGNTDFSRYMEYGRINWTDVNLTEEWQKLEFSFFVSSDDTAIVGNTQRVRAPIQMSYEPNLNAAIYLDHMELKEGYSAFDGELGADAVTIGVDGTETLPIRLLSTNGVPVEAFQYTLTYDPAVVAVTVPDQPGTLSENFSLEVNEPVPGKLVLSAASTDFIFDTGVLMILEVTGVAEGEGILDFTNVVVNESMLDGFFSDLFVGRVFICGDVSADGAVSATDASYVLRHTVFLAPQYPLTDMDSTAADVTGNGWISAYDASQILKFDAGIPAIMRCSSMNAKAQPLFAELKWDVVSTENSFEVNFLADNVEGDLLSAEMSIPLNDGLNFTGFKNAPENWQVYSNKVGDVLHISMFGVEAFSRSLLGSVIFERTGTFNGEALQAEVILNENERVALAPLTIADIPNEFELYQNYPNPFNPSTQIKYSVPEEAKVQLIVYNLLGQKVAELVNENMLPGRYTVTWDAGSQSSGVYMYRLVAGDQVFTKKMMLIK